MSDFLENIVEESNISIDKKRSLIKIALRVQWKWCTTEVFLPSRGELTSADKFDIYGQKGGQQPETRSGVVKEEETSMAKDPLLYTKHSLRIFESR